jgi:hypothetical protein
LCTIAIHLSFKQETEQYTNSEEIHTTNNWTCLQEMLCFSKLVINSKECKQPSYADLPPKSKKESVYVAAKGRDRGKQ